MAPSKRIKTYKDAFAIDGLKSTALRASHHISGSDDSSAPSYVFGPKSVALKKVALGSQERITRSQAASLVKGKSSVTGESTSSGTLSYVFGPKSAAHKKSVVAPVSQERTLDVAKTGSTNGATVSRPLPTLIVEVHIPSRQISSPMLMPSETAPHFPACDMPLPPLPLSPARPLSLYSGHSSPHSRPISPYSRPQSPPFFQETPPLPEDNLPTMPPFAREMFPDPGSPIPFRRPMPLFLDSDEEDEQAHMGTSGHAAVSHNSDGGGDVEDETGEVLSGGRLSSAQISEVHAIVMKMREQIEAKAKEWKHSTESLLRVGNILISTKERRHGGNSWNAFQSSFERDTDENRPHSQYIETVIKPAYDELIKDHGGVDSAEWKAKAEQLIEEHRSTKAAAAVAIAQLPSDVGKAMKQTIKRWEDDLKWLATLNVHGLVIMVSGIPDPAASKHNSMICGSKPMRDWAEANLPIRSSLLPVIHSHIVASQGQPLLQSKRKEPKDMHKMRKEIKDELQCLVLPFGSSIARVPWGSLPSFFANNHLKIDNWPPLAEFPAIEDLAVDQVRTDSWRSLWLAFFNSDKRIRVTSLSDLAKANEGRLPGGTVLVSDSLGNALVTTETDNSHSGGEGVDESLQSNIAPSNSTLGKHGLQHTGQMQEKKRRRKDGEATKGSGKKRRQYKSSEFIQEDGPPESCPAPPVQSPKFIEEDLPESRPALPVPTITFGPLSRLTRHVPGAYNPNPAESPDLSLPSVSIVPDGIADQLADFGTWPSGIPAGNAQLDDPLLPHLEQWNDLALGLNDFPMHGYQQ